MIFQTQVRAHKNKGAQLAERQVWLQAILLSTRFFSWQIPAITYRQTGNQAGNGFFLVLFDFYNCKRRYFRRRSCFFWRCVAPYVSAPFAGWTLIGAKAAEARLVFSQPASGSIVRGCGRTLEETKRLRDEQDQEVRVLSVDALLAPPGPGAVGCALGPRKCWLDSQAS